MTDRDKYFIISVDCGGCRGVIPSMLLNSLGDATVRNADLFAGTSTGAIIAGGLASGVSIGAINDVYRCTKDCRTIFTPERSGIFGDFGKLLHAQYSSAGIRSTLEKFPETKKTVGSLDKHCYLPSFLIDGSDADGPQWLATAFHNFGEAAGLGGFGHVSVLDAIMGSAAAPMFFNPHQIGTLLFVDGGVMANNPSMVALAAATHAGIVGPRGVPIERVCLLSLGTGTTESDYPPEPADWLLGPFGMLGWMWPTGRGKTTPALPAMQAQFDGVAQLNDYQVRSILRPDNYRRAELDFGTASFPMDDCSKVTGTDGLIERTERYMATDEWKAIAEWAKERLR